MKEIILSNGLVTIVDEEDYEYLNRWNWHCDKRKHVNYARRTIKEKGKHYTCYMHHEIIKRMKLHVPLNHDIDHIDRDSLNNQRNNLRVVSKSFNRLNSKTINNNIGIRGICYLSQRNRYQVQVTVNKVRVFTNQYYTLEEAVEARRKAEIKYNIYPDER